METLSAFIVEFNSFFHFGFFILVCLSGVLVQFLLFYLGTIVSLVTSSSFLLGFLANIFAGPLVIFLFHTCIVVDHLCSVFCSIDSIRFDCCVWKVFVDFLDLCLLLLYFAGCVCLVAKRHPEACWNSTRS